MESKYRALTVSRKMANRNCHVLSICLLLPILFAGCPDDYNPVNDDNEEVIDYLTEIEGTWQDTESTRSCTINSLHILFQYPNPVPSGSTITYGNFEYVYYDGSIVNIYDYDSNIVSFTAIFEDNILSISGLGTIKVFDDPFDERDFSPWNTTFIKE